MNTGFNPGHDEMLDPGACDPVQSWEGDWIDTKEAVWCKEVIGMAIAKMQRKGHKAAYIQSNSLGEICAMANASGVDVFISLHLNAAESTSAQGPETYFCTGSADGQRLAECVQAKLVQKLGAQARDRGIKPANFYVLKYTSAPAVLVEAAFITNVWEESIVHQQWFKDAVSDALVEGALAYAGKEE